MADILHFSTSIYSAEAVDETVTAYAQLVECEVRRTETSVEVSLSPKLDGVDDLVDHFANHVLHLSIAQSRGAST